MRVPTVEVIIVNWNAGAQLHACLESLAEVEQKGFRLGCVTVVDNGSVDGSVDRIPSLPIPLRVIRNRENRGFGAACNQGAAESEADYLLFLNPDMRLFPDSMAAAVEAMAQPEHAKTGISGIQMVDESGCISRSCARLPSPGMMLFYLTGLDRLLPKRFPGFFMEEWDHTGSREVDHVIGAFFLVRRELFSLLGGFDENFFVYFEDVDFSRRAKDAGFRSYFFANARAYHKGGGTSEQAKASRLFYSLRSRILYGYKHFGWWSATGLLLGTLTVEPAIRVAHSASRLSGRQVAETLKAYAMLWRGLPSLLTQRQQG